VAISLKGYEAKVELLKILHRDIEHHLVKAIDKEDEVDGIYADEEGSANEKDSDKKKDFVFAYEPNTLEYQLCIIAEQCIIHQWVRDGDKFHQLTCDPEDARYGYNWRVYSDGSRKLWILLSRRTKQDRWVDKTLL
jgi:hypothetical protein